MTPPEHTFSDRRRGYRRAIDEFRYWLPIMLYLSVSLLSLGVVYGKLAGRLDLIEYRLGAIERSGTPGR
jgi:hypothetical protein